ncbi:MAG: DUF1565 domain-containing protein [Proteobacteria bacterium]|nr:DUF1565 domain-containing protein [Pseudomonadota bacterium]
MGALSLVVGLVTAAKAQTVARATEVPACTAYVDGNVPGQGDGTSAKPWQRISEAADAVASGAVICVAEGIYQEQLAPGEKYFSLAGGFQSGSNFQVRDSARFVSKLSGNGGIFLRVVDPAPTGEQLTAVDGFDISGFSQAIVRDFWESQRFDITNNFIHDNVCSDQALAGAAFALVNISGTISGNVIHDNKCGRGGAGFLNDSTNKNAVVIENNWVEGNAGTEPDSSHGGGFYFFGNTLRISGNTFLNNSVTKWGGGLYVGAYTAGNQPTTATLSDNVFRGNRAGNAGGGFFCDDGAVCNVTNDFYEKNCGGNILLDGGPDGSDPTRSTFDHITNIFALSVDCQAPGVGVMIENGEINPRDQHSFKSSVFWGNAKDADFGVACGSSTPCEKVIVTVESSRVQQTYGDGTIFIRFAADNLPPADPSTVPPFDGGAAPSASANSTEATTANAQLPLPAPVEQQVASPVETSAASAGSSIDRAISRGEAYMGFKEAFNRSYTDPSWVPSVQLFVGPSGGGDGSSPQSPMAASDALRIAKPGTLIHFLRGTYAGGLELTAESSGSYDDPIVIMGEPADDGGPGVQMSCEAGKRKTCFNLEGASYVAIRGFELIGGVYGVRAVGSGYDASQHSRGILVMNNSGHGQERDPFFSAQSDWNIWENNIAYDAQDGDGHGLYISNGSDWNIVRFNETHSNASSGFQINADPMSTCSEDGVAVDDPSCDAYAGTGEGGRGASDYFLIEANHFHHDAVGPNFTSLRRSVIRNNVFGLQNRHNVSFWQETENPKLGSSDNAILHNLFLSSGKHAVQFINNSSRNIFKNNVLLGVTINSGTAAKEPRALLMEVDDTAKESVFGSNFYGAGYLEGRSPNSSEIEMPEFSAEWFAAFPASVTGNVNGYIPTSKSPYLDAGALLMDAVQDWNATPRTTPADLGPFEAH